jgi:CRISPR-associated protein Cas2
MWMMVMFDLPVVSKRDRKRYAQFRKFLLEQGFEMSQYSVYFRFCGNKEHTAPFVRKIKENSPPHGNVSILFFTDKQFGNIITIQNRRRLKNPEKPEQLLLF